MRKSNKRRQRRPVLSLGMLLEDVERLGLALRRAEDFSSRRPSYDITIRDSEGKPNWDLACHVFNPQSAAYAMKAFMQGFELGLTKGQKS